MFEQRSEIAEKYEFLSPSPLLDTKFEINLQHAPDDINMASFILKRK